MTPQTSRPQVPAVVVCGADGGREGGVCDGMEEGEEGVAEFVGEGEAGLALWVGFVSLDLRIRVR